MGFIIFMSLVKKDFLICITNMKSIYPVNDIPFDMWAGILYMLFDLHALFFFQWNVIYRNILYV